MKFLFLGILVVGGGVGLWRLWIALREKDRRVSDRWVSDRERLDQISAGQWDGYVRWPWDGDDAA